MKLTKEINDAVLKYSKEYKLDPIVVLAIIETESGYNPFAIRYEPGFKWLYSSEEMAFILRINKSLMIAMQKLSVGLMQPMLSVCNEYGFRGCFYDLFNIDLNIMYGCKHLSKLIKTQNLFSVEQIYDAYNTGNGNDKIVNQNNLDRFMKIYNRINQ